jgi:hypothetical protein
VTLSIFVFKDEGTVFVSVEPHTPVFNALRPRTGEAFVLLTSQTLLTKLLTFDGERTTCAGMLLVDNLVNSRRKLQPFDSLRVGKVGEGRSLTVVRRVMLGYPRGKVKLAV